MSQFGRPDVPTTTVAALPDPLPEGLAVLDVREPDEWQAGHIEGAVHIPLGELPLRHTEVPTRPTVVVCKVGGRSAQAVAYLSAQGLDVVNLDGGMLEWEAAGRWVVAEGGTAGHVI